MVGNFIFEIGNDSFQMGQKLKGLDWFRTNFVTAKLAGSPSVLIKQLTSFVAYAEKMPVNQFVKYHAMFWANPVKNAKEL